jgi:hypothetical protein
VVDASGAATPGVMISFKNVATGNIRKAVTNQVGFYIAPNPSYPPATSFPRSLLAPAPVPPPADAIAL